MHSTIGNCCHMQSRPLKFQMMYRPHVCGWFNGDDTDTTTSFVTERTRTAEGIFIGLADFRTAEKGGQEEVKEVGCVVVFVREGPRSQKIVPS